MVDNYNIVILKSAEKDKEKIKTISALKLRVENLLQVLKDNPLKYR